MRSLLFTLVLLAQVTVFATVKNQACRSKSQIQNEMNAISSNIANVSTTRTPEGGPYKRQSYDCVAGQCNINQSSKYVTKYLPDHPDADAEGYVKFPDINLEKEMQNMIEATRAYEKAVETCPLTSDEACEKAQEKKATYNFLIKKLGKDPGVNMDAIIGEIKRASLDYKELNSQCKR